MRRLLFLVLLPAGWAAQQPSQPTFSVTSELVVVNVEVRDRSGRPVEGLRKEDFEVRENGQLQNISVFEYQSLPAPDTTQPASIEVRPEPPPSQPAASPKSPIRYQDRRLIVLFFDLSSMPPEDQVRAQEGARQFLRDRMTPADLVAVMTFSTRLRVLQNFTADRDLLERVIGGFRVGEASGLAGLAETGETDTGEDTGAAFTADESEFNIFNTDRKLSALESAAKMLGSLAEKKALVYFSSGVAKTGVENQSQLRSTVNAAIRGNVSFYPVDVRGLVAEAPGGDASQASNRGSSMYSGAAQRQRVEQFNDRQETLYTLAADTGGRALLDNNDLSLGIIHAQQDISSYYTLGYYGANQAMDGKYRRIEVRLPSQANVKLAYRAGYYAEKQFRDFTSSDRERQLEEALLLEDPMTDLPIAMEVDYFRRAPDRYIVPVALKIPGSQIEVARRKNRESTRLDFIGQVRDPQGRLVGAVRDFIQVKLSGENIGKLAQRQLQYDTAFTLPHGTYTLKFLVRENETGRMGTFETGFTIPDLREEKSYLRLSSVVWSNQRVPLAAAVGAAERNRKSFRSHPLVQGDQKLIPSITRVFRPDQNLYVYLEVYDAKPAEGPAPSVTASVSLYRDRIKEFETEPFRVAEAQRDKGDAMPVEIELPLSKLEPGSYTCQVSVIDETGRKFAFRRAPLILLPGSAPSD